MQPVNPQLEQTQIIPESPWLRLGHTLLSLCAGIAIVGALFFLVNNSLVATTKPIEKVIIEGELNALAPQMVADAVALYETDTIWSVSLERIAAELEQLPWVERVTIERVTSSNAIRVKVEEHKAIAYWGDKQMVSTRGELFEHKGLGLNRELPRMWSALVMPAEAMSFYQIFERQLAQADLKLFAITQSLQGDWQVTLSDRSRVLLDHSNPSKSIRQFVSIYQQVIRPSGRAVKVIDLRYRHGAAIQWQETTEAAQAAGENAKGKPHARG